VNDERVLDGHQDVFLVLDVVDLFETNHLGDRHHFEREIFTRRPMSRQNYAPERTRPLTTEQVAPCYNLKVAVTRIKCKSVFSYYVR